MAIFLDGKTFADATMVIALGITITGEKDFLGFVETDTENEKVLSAFLRSLLGRGLDISQGILAIIDGGKGLRAAVRKVFPDRVAGAALHVAQARERGELSAEAASSRAGVAGSSGRWIVPRSKRRSRR